MQLPFSVQFLTINGSGATAPFLVDADGRRVRVLPEVGQLWQAYEQLRAENAELRAENARLQDRPPKAETIPAEAQPEQPAAGNRKVKTPASR